MLPRSISVIVAMLSLVVSTAADDWLGFRGPNSAGISQDKGIPTTWDDSSNLAWKQELPGKGFSSPIVVGDHVFVTCYSNESDLENLVRHLVCLDRETGKEVWSKEIPSTSPERSIPRFAGTPGYASSTPVSDGTNVYVLFGSSGVYAYDLKGKALWHKDVGSQNAAMFGSASSPIIYGENLIVQAGSESRSIRSLDLKTGEEKWSSPADTLARSYSTPIVARHTDDSQVLLVSIPQEIWAVNPATGKLKWYAETRVDTGACPVLVADDDVVYAIGGRSGGRTAIRLGGKGDVTESHTVWSRNGGAYVPSPVLHDGHLYWVTDRGLLNCIDVKTGEEAGRARLNGQFYASIQLIGDHLFAVSRFGGTYVVKADPELKQVSHNKLDDKSDFSASPAVSNGSLFIRSDTAIYCIRK